MSLTSSSTIDDALNQYNNNLLWEGDITKAQNALEAVRYILANRPKWIASGGRSVTYDALVTEKEKLMLFVSNSGTSVNRVTFTRGRMLT
jgi:hypothetical protein